MQTERAEAVIFDMDNTLIRSRIDFATMKKETAGLLAKNGLLPEGFNTSPFTTVTLMDSVRGKAGWSEQLENTLWRRIAEIEEEGMIGADLEPGAAELLERLQGKLILAVLTNNADRAAQRALRETGIDRRFDLIVGRDSLPSLKPSPDGVIHVLSRYAQIPPDRWISVGDSWTDGAAAALAGVRFVAYGADLEAMKARGVHPVGVIRDLRELVRYL